MNLKWLKIHLIRDQQVSYGKGTSRESQIYYIIYIYIYIYKFHMPHTGERYDSVYMYIFFEKLAPVNFYLGGALV